MWKVRKSCEIRLVDADGHFGFELWETYATSFLTMKFEITSHGTDYESLYKKHKSKYILATYYILAISIQQMGLFLQVYFYMGICIC